VLRTAIAVLTAHVGGDPSAAEALLIQSAGLKAKRALLLLSEKLLAGGEVGVDGDRRCLAWLNSMRQDLAALGLARRVRDVTPTLARIGRVDCDDDA
jgi:hypothetical protein